MKQWLHNMALGLTPQQILDKNEYQLLRKADRWLRVPLAEVARVQSGYPFKSELFDRHTGVPLIRIRDITRRETEHRYIGEYDPEYLVRHGDILIGMDGDFVAARWQGGEALLNQRVCRVIPDSRHFDEKFLFLCLQPYLDAINAETSSVTVKHLSSRTIEAIPLPIPPLREQRRIVAKIEELFSELDKGVESLKTAREQLKVYRQAVLKHAFEGKLTARWREQHKDKLPSPEQLLTHIQAERNSRYVQHLKEWEVALREWEATGEKGSKPSKPRAPKSVGVLSADVRHTLPDLPEGWTWEKLGWMTCGVEYGTAAKSSESGAVPVVRMGNLQNGAIDWRNLAYTSDEEEIRKYSLRTGDVLFNRTNSPELVGKTAIYRGERPALFAGYLIRINHIPLVVDGQYLSLFLSSHVAKQYGNAVKTDGVNQSNINGEKLVGYPFPYCSLDEQAEIVRLLDEKLSLTDQMMGDIEAQLSRSEALRQSILKRAFSGQLVPQDPNDEPASVLLERIRAEKTAQGNKPRRQRTSLRA